MRVNREDFLARLQLLQPGLSKQEVVEQSACFVFSDKTAMTFNDEIACTIKSPIPEITGAVIAAPLVAILQKMAEDEIDVEASDEELIIKGKRRRVGIRMEAQVTLPIDSVEKPTEWKTLHEEFCEAVSIVEQCAGSDDSKFSMTCVHITPKWLEACDCIQATRYRLPTGFDGECLARGSSLKFVSSLGMTEFCETEKWLHFRNQAKLVLSCRRFIEDYPSLKDILRFEGTEIQLPKGLAEAADRADVFASGNADDGQILIRLENGKVNLRGEGAVGWYSETRKLGYTGPEFEFTVAPKLFREIVQRHSVCEITKDRLKVNSGKFTFVTCLGTNAEPGVETMEEAETAEAD